MKTTIIEIDTLYNNKNFTCEITRKEFNLLCNDIFLKTFSPINIVLEDANINKNDINDIILVGGSTRIPKIQEMLIDYFDGKQLCKTINPDEVVASGAAIQAAILSGNSDSKLDQIVLIDILQLSLGIEISGGLMNVIIPRLTPLPVKKTSIFTTTEDNQQICIIKIYEGERIIASDNNKLGEFIIKDIYSMPRGVPKIEITYYIDANGILIVSAIEKSCGINKTLQIENKNIKLSNEYINNILKEAELAKDYDIKIKKNIEAKNELEILCYVIKRSLDTTFILNSNQLTIKHTINKLINWIPSSNLNANQYNKIKNKLENFIKKQTKHIDL